MNFIRNLVTKQKTHRLFLGVVALTLSAGQSFAEKKELVCDENKTLIVKVSASALTRLSIQGDRFRDVIGLDENVSVEKDETNGHLFLKGITAKQTITVITEGGVMQDLTLIPFEKGSTNVVLKLEASSQMALSAYVAEGGAELDFDRGRGSNFNAANLNGSIPAFNPFPTLFKDNSFGENPSFNLNDVLIGLIKMLYLGKEHSHTSNFDRINKLETPKLDAIPSRKNNHGLEAIPVQSIASNGLSALAFRIHNEGKDPLSLSEKEFYKRGDLALSLEKTELEAGESTTLFIITNA